MISTRSSGIRCAASYAGGCAAHGGLGGGRHHRPGVLAQGGGAGLRRLRRPRGARRPRHPRLPLQRDHRRGGRVHGHRVSDNFALDERHRAPVPDRARDRGAAGSAGCRTSPAASSSCAIAMSEPGAGSDLRGIASTATWDGDALHAQRLQDVRHQRHPGRPGDRRRARQAGRTSTGLGLFVVEDGMEGFSRGRKLDKIGRRAQDTAELFFDDVARAARERASARRAAGCTTDAQPRRRSGCRSRSPRSPSAERALELTLDYVTRAPRVRPADRQLPGQPLRAGRARHRGQHRPRLRRPLHRGHVAGELTRRGGGRREVLDHRAAVPGARSLPAAARRLRVHGGVRDRPAVARRPGAADIRRHERDHEGDRRTLAGAVRTRARADGPTSYRKVGRRLDRAGHGTEPRNGGP